MIFFCLKNIIYHCFDRINDFGRFGCCQVQVKLHTRVFPIQFIFGTSQKKIFRTSSLQNFLLAIFTWSNHTQAPLADVGGFAIRTLATKKSVSVPSPLIVFLTQILHGDKKPVDELYKNLEMKTVSCQLPPRSHCSVFDYAFATCL